MKTVNMDKYNKIRNKKLMKLSFKLTRFYQNALVNQVLILYQNSTYLYIVSKKKKSSANPFI